jgi:NADH-quinone oxidoreductase subunit M
MHNIPALSILIALPGISAAFLLLLGVITGRIHLKCFAVFSKYFILFASLLELILSVLLGISFKTSEWMQFNERYDWISLGNLNISILLGIDGISLSFIILTAVLIPICLLASWNYITNKIPLYFSLFLFTESILIGFFSSLNILLFYVFFEAVLIPLFLIIGIWGGSKRIYATYKFFLYTFCGSLLMLIAIIYISIQQCNPLENTTGLACAGGPSNMIVLGGFIQEQFWQTQGWLWWFIFIGLAVKVPMWPFHTWLPYAHVQAPTGGSMILAGVLLKMGGYGMIRLLIDPFPRLSAEFADIVIIMSIIGIIYTSLVALAQKDMKKLIAYSSVAHMGYVTAGLFSGQASGISGAVFQMISHGILSPALFFIVGILYERTHTKKISFYSGVAKVMPRFAIFFMISLLGSIGLPGTSGFIGEFATIAATMHKNIWYGLLMSAGVVFGAVYMLKLYGSVMFHETNEKTISLKDVSFREWTILVILSALTLALGIYPSFITTYIENPLQYLGQFYEFSLNK